MKKITYLLLVFITISCSSDDFEPKKNEFGTQILLEDRDKNALFQRYFVFRSIVAKEEPYDFDGDENASFDILAQFPECAIDDSYQFQSELFRISFLGNQCDPGISPFEGFNNYFIIDVEGSEMFQLAIYNTDDLDQRIDMDNFEVYENEEGKRTIVGEWISFNPDFVFDVVMTEIDRPE